MDLRTKIYQQFDSEGIKGKKRSVITLNLNEGVSQENSGVFIPDFDYYNLKEDELSELIIDYVYDTTSFKINTVNDLKKLQNINGLPFMLEISDPYKDEARFCLARKHINGSVKITDPKITSLGNVEEIDGDLALLGSNLHSLGKLRRVNGSLWIGQTYPFTNLESLEDLEYVGRDLYLKSSPIKDLSKLKKVGRFLNLRKTDIQSLGLLQHVGNSIYLPRTKRDVFQLEKVKIFGAVRYYSS